MNRAIEDLQRTIRFGLEEACVPHERKAQDFQLLVELLMRIWTVRIQRFEAAQRDLSMQDIWDTYKLECILSYFQKTYRYNAYPLYFSAGIHRVGYTLSATEAAQFPVPSNLPCGPTLVPPAVNPPYPPLFPRSCGAVVASATYTRDCINFTFTVNLYIAPSPGFLLGMMNYTVNGVSQTPQQALTGLNVIGPFDFGDVVDTVVYNELNPSLECAHVSGPFSVPPAAEYSILDQGDVGDVYNQLVPLGLYYVISDDDGVIGSVPLPNVAIGDIVNGFAQFVATPAVGDILFLGAPGAFYEVIGVGALAAQHLPVVLTHMVVFPYWTAQVVGLPPSMTYVAAVIEVLNGVTWTPIWAGLAGALEVGVAINDPDLVAEGVRITYYNNPCPVTVTGEIEIDDTIVRTDCTGIVDLTYRYTDAGIQGFVFNAPSGQFPELMFGTGFILGAAVVTFYDSADNSGPILPSGNGFSNQSLAGLIVTATGQYLYMEINSGPGEELPDDSPTWLFQLSCAQGLVPPQAGAVIADDCDTNTFVATVEIYDLGDANPASLYYSVDFGPYILAHSGIAAPFTFWDIPAVPNGSLLAIRLVSEANPLVSWFLGSFTDSGSCPEVSDPCAPTGGFKVNQVGDVQELLYPPPITSWGVILTGDVTNIGTFGPAVGVPGMYVVWNDGTQEYDVSTYLPGVIDADPEYWFSGGPGIQPYNLYPVVELTPTGLTPLNWELFIPEILQQGTPDNKPLTVRVRQGIGPWITIWSGLEQDLATPIQVTIVDSFSNAQVVWEPLVCGFIGGAIINSIVSTEPPPPPPPPDPPTCVPPVTP